MKKEEDEKMNQLDELDRFLDAMEEIDITMIDIDKCLNRRR